MTTYLPPEENFWKKVINSVKSTIFPFQYGPDKQAENITRQLIAQREFETERRELEFVKLKVQYHRDREQRDWSSTENWLNREFQGQENDKNRQLQVDIVAYTKHWDYQMLKKRINFDLFLHQERKTIELELQQQNHRNQVALSLLNTQKAKETEEYRRILATFPFRSTPSIFIEGVEKRHKRGERVPFLITVSPPDIDFEPYQGQRPSIPPLERSLNEAMRIFFQTNYPKHDKERPVEFVGGLWDSNRYHSEAAIKNLHYLMPCVPTLVINTENTEVNGDLINLHLGIWNAGEEYNFISILSEFNAADFCSEACRREATDWGKNRQDLLLELGEDEFNKIGGDKENNWNLLQKEQKTRLSGKTFTEKYRFTPKALKELENHLILLHKLIAGIVADQHFFVNYQTPPKLPIIIPELLKDKIPEEQNDILDFVIANYARLGEELVNVNHPLAADFIIDLAENTINLLPSSQWIKSLTISAINIWLIQQNISNEKQTSLAEVLHQMRPYANKISPDFLKKLVICLGHLEEIKEYKWLEETMNEAKNLSENPDELESDGLKSEEELESDGLKSEEELESDGLKSEEELESDGLKSEKEVESLLEKFKNEKGKKFTFLLVGRCGVGKSSTVNSLMGKPIAPVGDFEPTTMEIKKYESEIAEVKFTLIDTPGLCDELEEKGNDYDYLERMRIDVDQVDLMWFTTRLDDTRVYSDEKRGIKLISEVFKSKIWEHAIIVFTFAGNLSPDKYPVALQKRTELIRMEIAKYVGEKIANEIPSVAVDNLTELTPDGERWLGELYTKVYKNMAKEGAGAFLMSTVERIQKPTADRYFYRSRQESTPSPIYLNERQAEEVGIKTGQVLGSAAAGAAVGAVFGGPAGAVIGATIATVATVLSFWRR